MVLAMDNFLYNFNIIIEQNISDEDYLKIFIQLINIINRIKEI